MAIIGTLPNTISNGQAVDATPVMADFNFIVNQVNANANPIGTLTAPSGTRTIFHQAAAPLGWTQDVTLTDHTLQVVGVAGGATGGANGYSTLFSTQWTSDGHALTTAELAVHAHGTNDPGHVHGVNDPGHSHAQHALTYYNVAGNNIQGGGALTINNTAANTVAATTGISLALNGTNVTIQNAGSGSAHTHTKTFNANYAQVIMCAKT